MFKTILQKASEYSKVAIKGAIQNSGIAALYLCSATLLAGILLTAILTYKWDIDEQKWYRALAILQGIELAEIQQAERDKVAGITHDRVLTERAAQSRRDEFRQEITNRSTSLQLPPEDPKPLPPPPPSANDRIDAYEQRVKADIAKSRSAGLDEQTRLIENMRPDMAKEVIRKLWKDGFMQRVLQMLTAMEEKNQERILYAMRESDDEELKDLCEILQRIGDGEPMTSILEEAGKEP